MNNVIYNNSNQKTIRQRVCSLFVVFALLFSFIFPAFSISETRLNAFAQDGSIMPDGRQRRDITDEDETENSEDPAEEINYTVFIKNATYAIYYNETIYFIDEVDSNNPEYILKSYNIENKVFNNEHIELEGVGTIIDVAYNNGRFFLLTDNGVYVVDLDELKIKQINFPQISLSDESSEYIAPADFSAISAYFYDNTDPKVPDEIMLFLTPKNDDGKEISPFIFKLYDNFDFNDDENIEVKKYTKINLSGITNPTKIMALDSTETSGSINILVTYNQYVSYLILTKDSLDKQSEITINENRTFSQVLDVVSSSVEIISINLSVIEEIPHLVVTYKTSVDSDTVYYSRIYRIKISQYSDNSSLIPKEWRKVEESAFCLTSDDYLISTNVQSIRYVKILIVDHEGDNYGISFVDTTVRNPEIDITYDPESKFVYSSTKEATNLMKTPWSIPEETIEIEENTDVIVIGKGYIIPGKQAIEDYLYCLYTNDGVNYQGFIEASKLTSKEVLAENGEIQIPTYNSVLKVIPNSALYSLPTKVVGDSITDELYSYKIMDIKENTKIDFVDSIYGYTSNGSKFLKVAIGDRVGYIEYDSLISPSDSRNFVLTNAYILNDNTYVALDDDTYMILNSEKRVRVNGTRDTKTGLTSITFNDEFGNEFSGYISTDEIKTDGWSALQIIGCVLIAINIGLLILILYFKDSRIGHDGQKFDRSKKSN